MKLGDAIRKARQKHNLTQGDLAKLADIPQSTLSTMERTSKNIRIEHLRRITNVVNMTIEELISLSEPVETNIITYSNELLTHFNCKNCELLGKPSWWSISEFDINLFTEITCPRCATTIHISKLKQGKYNDKK